jgi:hypothetical protein
MPDAARIASTGREVSTPDFRAADPPAPARFDPAVLVVLEAERQAADAARAQAEHRYAVASEAEARYLAEHGPQEVGGWRLVGLTAPGASWGLVLRELAIAPAGPDPGAVEGAHACIAVDPDLLEGDAE